MPFIKCYSVPENTGLRNLQHIGLHCVWEDETVAQMFSRIICRKHHLKNLRLYSKITQSLLQRVKIYTRYSWLKFDISDFCEDGNELSVTLKEAKILDQTSDYQVVIAISILCN